MKTRTLTRTLCLIAIFCLLLSSASAAAPAAETVQPRYTNIIQYYADLEITSAGRADCYVYIKLANTTDSVTLTMTLQRSSDKTNWSDVKSWSTTGKSTVYLDESYYVVSGYYYQLVATANVYTSAGSLAETASTPSGTVKY